MSESMNDTADFVVVDNRLPVERTTEGGENGWKVAPGGLVTALEPVLRQHQGVWVGWAGSPDEALDPFEADGIKVRPVELSARDVTEYYEGMSNGTLWPLYHDSVAFPEYHREWWQSYVAVNERFAKAAAESASEGAVVWVQDYQLQLVPQMLRHLRPDVQIGFFLHIPFPPSELFHQLPWREDILDGLAGADLIGFQVPKDAHNFVRLVKQLLGAETRGDRFRTVQGHLGRAQAYPISIDSKGLSELAGTPEVQQRAAEIRADLDAETIIFGVDRLDYTKGIRERIRAMGELFLDGELDPETTVFLQVATPSREQVGDYQRLRDDIDQLVGRINGDIGRIGRAPITYLHTGYARAELAAMFVAADVCLVTPLRDGMNLVAKEYVACRNDEQGALVLSEFAGAAQELTDAWLVNPYDLNGLKVKVRAAVSASAEEKQRRMKALREQVFTHDIQRWAKSFLDDLAEIDAEDSAGAWHQAKGDPTPS